MPSIYTVNLIPAVMAAEGFSPDVYLDSRNNPTVGYGHLLTYPFEKSLALAKITLPLSQPAAAELLVNDLLRAACTAQTLFPNASVPSVRTDTLIELAFIMGDGSTGLASWRKLIKAVRNDQPVEAAWQILDSRAFRQIPERILTLALRYLTRRY